MVALTYVNVHIMMHKHTYTGLETLGHKMSIVLFSVNLLILGHEPGPAIKVM